MKTIKENKEIFGKLHTSFGEFELLSAEPNKKSVPWYFHDYDVLSFFVMDKMGIGQNILVRGEFMIAPIYGKKFKEVTFIVEEEVDIQKELDRQEELRESD